MGLLTKGGIGRILWSGAMRQIPGLEADPGQYGGVPFFYSTSGGTVQGLDLVAAVTGQNSLLIPFRAKILSVRIRIRTVTDATATVSLSKRNAAGAQAGYFVAAHSITTAMTPEGTITIPTLAQTIIAANEVLYWEANGGATAAGVVDALVVIVPWLGT